MPISKRDAYMRNNYEKGYNVDTKDGDFASTKFYIENVGLVTNQENP